MLALAGRHIEPNLRARHAYEWAIDKRWVGLDAAGRAQIATALLAACGKVAPPPELERLADWNLLSEAVSWGLGIRLCRRLGAGTRASLRASSLTREGDKLVLALEAGRAPLASDKVVSELKTLAQWLALEPEVRLTQRAAGKHRAADLTRV
jgi:exopolyphosphatase/guanosine-5'-triphosphate,3'-diphosphate pyrophosphatase